MLHLYLQNLPCSTEFITNFHPEKFLLNLMKEGDFTFEEVFLRFTKEESVYGFGDLQLKNLYDKVIVRNKG